MFQYPGRLAAAHPWKIIAFWVLLAIGLAAIAPPWASQALDDDVRFLPSQYPIVRGLAVMERAFPNDIAASHVGDPAGFDSLSQTIWATVLLVVVVLTLIYRSPILALIPLISVGIAVAVSVELLALLTLIPGMPPVDVSRVFLVVILFGAMTDYSLLLISRFREELETGQDAARSTQRAVRTVGGALAASAGTVMVGLGMMGFAEFGRIRSAGPAIALGLAIGVLASLTLTPALLRLGNARVFWPTKVRFRAAGTRRNGLWEAFSRYVVRHPGRMLALSVVPLVPLWYFGIQVEPKFQPIGDLSPNADSIRGLDALQKHSTAGEAASISVLLVAPADWKSVEGRAVLDDLSRGFGNLANIAEVRSLTQPMGESTAVGPAERSSAEKHYLGRFEAEERPQYVARLDLVLKGDPFEARSVDTLREVDSWLETLLPIQTANFAPVRAEMYGATVHMRDVERAIRGDRQRVTLLITLGVFLMLLAVVRKFSLAAMLLGTVLLSYVATLGATSLFAAWLTGRPPGPIEWRVPFFLFAILIAIGQDYNIAMISRIVQERKRHGAVESIRRGLAATGGTIAACGVILAGTFAILTTADPSTLRQIGFALAFGVLIDTFLVRPMMVPALLLLLRDDEEAEVSPVSTLLTGRPTMLKLFTAMSIPPMPAPDRGTDLRR